MAFSVFTELCNNHHYLIPEHFITPEKNLYPLAVTPHFLVLPLLPRNWQPPINFLSQWIAYWVFNINEIIQYVSCFVLLRSFNLLFVRSFILLHIIVAC